MVRQWVQFVRCSFQNLLIDPNSSAIRWFSLRRNLKIQKVLPSMFAISLSHLWQSSLGIVYLQLYSFNLEKSSHSSSIIWNGVKISFSSSSSTKGFSPFVRLQKHFRNLYLQRHKLGPNKNAFNLHDQFGPPVLVMKIKWINDLVLCSKTACNVIAKLWYLGIKNGWSFFQDFSIFIFFVVKGVQIHIFVSHAFQNFFTVFDDLFHFFIKFPFFTTESLFPPQTYWLSCPFSNSGFFG